MKKNLFLLLILTAFISLLPVPLPAEEATEEETAEPQKTALPDKVVDKVNQGTGKIIDKTIKGAYKVVTLGKSELKSYEVQEPEKGSGEPTKFKISIPGT